MTFEWNKIYKWEEAFEREIVDSVVEYVCRYYDVEDFDELTANQVDEIMEFMEGLNEYSVLQVGFRHLINYWEDASYEIEDE